MWNSVLSLIDWFVPDHAKLERSELGLARNFVFTHLFGPAMAQSMSLFLYLSDLAHGAACWTMIVAIWSFWTLPFVLKWTRNLQLAALLSVEILAFASLFGAYFYGGVSSPFLPWILVSLLLGLFYLSNRPLVVVGLFAANLIGFLVAFLIQGGFPQILPTAELVTVGWISIVSASIYMSWMAVYYVNMMAVRSQLELEAERHRLTSVRLRQAKEHAENANRARSIFLAKMSHELRTPLNAVIGYSELLLEDGEGDPARDGKLQDLRRINAAGRHLLSLVTDVLDLSSIEANRVEITPEVFDLNAFVDGVAATVRPLVSQNGNRLDVKLGDALGSICTDQTKLRQSIFNLLSNAAKFTQDGVITLSVSRERRGGGDWVELRVEDTGIGIAESDMPKLFQEFGQATVGTQNRYGGTGLGLALSQKFCDLLGGAITVRSEAGRGSCFTIRIPAQLPSAEPTAVAALAA